MTIFKAFDEPDQIDIDNALSPSPNNSLPQTILGKISFQLMLSLTNLIMPPKRKNQEKLVNPLIPPSIGLDRIPLVDRDYRISETQWDCEFLELYYWLEDKHVDKTDEIGLWDSNLPHYIFPLTFHALEFSKTSQACYVPGQRAIIAPSGDILFIITT